MQLFSVDAKIFLLSKRGLYTNCIWNWGWDNNHQWQDQALLKKVFSCVFGRVVTLVFGMSSSKFFILLYIFCFKEKTWKETFKFRNDQIGRWHDLEIFNKKWGHAKVRNYFGTNEPLTSWTLFSSLFDLFAVCAQQTGQKVRKKVFNWQRFICTEFTSYKIHTYLVEFVVRHFLKLIRWCQ